MPARSKRYIVPVDHIRGHRARAGELFHATYHRENVTKLAGISFALILPGIERDWSFYLSVQCFDSRVLIYEQAQLDTVAATPIDFVNSNRRYQLKAEGTAGSTEARLFVDPVVTAIGNNKFDVNIVGDGIKIGDNYTAWILASEGGPYLISIIPNPQLMDVSIWLEIMEEVEGK